jgi:hypothetical protein
LVKWFAYNVLKQLLAVVSNGHGRRFLIAERSNRGDSVSLIHRNKRDILRGAVEADGEDETFFSGRDRIDVAQLESARINETGMVLIQIFGQISAKNQDVVSCG